MGVFVTGAPGYTAKVANRAAKTSGPWCCDRERAAATGVLATGVNRSKSVHEVYEITGNARYAYGMQYRAHPNVKRLISLCRTEIVCARVLLARSPAHEQHLSELIESREFFIRLLSEDFHDEMENIDREIESVLSS